MRGYQKKVIFLKDTGSHLFDEAYFVVSREGEAAHIEQSDMVFEANKIIKESLGGKELRIRGGRRVLKKDFAIPFFLGALFMLIISVLFYLIII